MASIVLDKCLYRVAVRRSVSQHADMERLTVFCKSPRNTATEWKPVFFLPAIVTGPTLSLEEAVIHQGTSNVAVRATDPHQETICMHFQRFI
ncbi:hypothetical protein DPEC_G00056730 [Dallia pectoralis]|uniref:Uncharacterized protein n=1 Tax=Dallia pectoralis TaxID=75939 RepID=A0ACC2H6B7_DALPE|nr:hypothetical protein DPEC_G00056730 [Dallia pectoralis]